MTGIETDNGAIDSKALWKILQDLEDGTLGSDERDAVMELVGRSPDAQTAYLEYFEMAAMLGAEAATHAEEGKLPLVGQPQEPIQLFKRSLLAAAAVLALGAIVASLFLAKQPQTLSVQATEGAVWMVDGDSRSKGDLNSEVRAGSTLRVRSGTLKLKFDSGAAMVIQSPAQVYFPELEKPSVSYGWLWIDSGKSDKSFEVATPKLVIRDIGTRFGIRVPDDGPSEVHLIEGKVEISARSTGRRVAMLVPEGEGLAIEASGEMVGVKLANDPFPGIAELLAAPANYATTVTSQNPAGYWRMGAGSSTELSNEVHEGSAGRLREQVTEPAQGPGPSDGLKGFSEGNHSVRFQGGAGRAPVSLGVTPVHAGILFQENFDGKGPLHGTMPADTSLGAKWIAAPLFSRDGTIEEGVGSATLAFTPVEGVVYTLDASIRGVVGQGSWVAMGFSNGQNKSEGENARFVSQTVVGRAWMLVRGNLSKGPNSAFLGSSGTNGGVADERAWVGPLADVKADMDLRVVLNTAGGPGTWHATWYAKRPDEKDYLVVRATQQLLTEEIRSVGIAVNGIKSSGSISAFSLRADSSEASKRGGNLASAPANMSRREGAVSFWVRQDPKTNHREIVWTAGESPWNTAIQVHIEPDGQVGFFLENGRFDILLTSEESVSRGKWHHVATSWSPSSVNLYLDGKPAALSTEFRGMRKGRLSEIQFGSGALGSDAAPFTGCIDEIAVWNRGVTPTEVSRQFRSAQGE